MAATAAVFQSLLPGEHVIAPQDAYYGTAKLLREVMTGWGLESTLVDMTDVARGRGRSPARDSAHLDRDAVQSGPRDHRHRADRRHRPARLGRRCVCDNTWATPLLQRPLALGCDAVMHSTTKYLGGHSDLTGGALVLPADDEWAARLRTLQQLGGAVPSAFDCWLLMRGIRSARLADARALRERGAGGVVPGVTPGGGGGALPRARERPGHAVAARQMAGFGGMVSVEVKGGADAALGVVRRVKLFTAATSLGGTESLIEHRASVEGPESRTPPGLLRLSIGLEHAEDLVGDLDQALARGYSLLTASGWIRRSARLAAAAISSLISSSIIFLSFGTAALAGRTDLGQRDVTGKRTEASGSSSASISAGTAGAAAGPIPEIS